MLALTLATVPACGERPWPPPQRVFLVTIDTLRADHLGYHGYPREVSPFLDRLAADSVVFLHAISASSHTAPSHATLFTGLYPAQHGLLRNGEELNDRVLTLAEVLRDRGYRTAAFSPVRFLEGASAGFEQYSRSDQYTPAAEVLGRAERWLRAVGADSPAFVWIHLFDVHQWRHDHHIDVDALARVESWAAEEPATHRDFLRSRRLDPDFVAASPSLSLAEVVNRYDAQLWSADNALGRFFETVERQGLYRDSLWIVTSDHGEGLGNHGHLGHGKHIYQEQVHVPLLFHFADGRARPGAHSSLVRSVDVAPTVAELVEGTLEGQVIPVEGRSLVAALRRTGVELERPAAFSQRRPADQGRRRRLWAPGQVFALQDAESKLIVASSGSRELYDLVRDPLEMNNLFDPGSEEHAARARKLTKRFRKMRRQAHALGKGEIGAEHLDELRALGYVFDDQDPGGR